jgi:hypothetical protein
LATPLRNPKFSRRSFLIVVAVSGATALAAPHLLDVLDLSGTGSAREQRGAARRIGRAYLASHPEENDASALERRLFGHSGGAWDARRAADTWETSCREDFRAGRLVAIEGWWLAPSEARLCALISLTAGRTT